MMRVYIIHRDIPYESGEVMGVFDNLKRAQETTLGLVEDTFKYDDLDNWSIEIWDLDKGYLTTVHSDEEFYED